MKDLIERGKQPGKNKVKEFMILLLIIAIAIPIGLLMALDFTLFIQIILGIIFGFIALVVFYEAVLKNVIVGQIILPLVIILLTGVSADIYDKSWLHFLKYALFFIWIGFWILKSKLNRK